MKKIRLITIIVLAGAVILFTGGAGWAKDTITIGVIGPMQFVQGEGHWNGAVMAAEEINAKGGVQVGKKKMKIELVQADSNEFLNVTDATNAMERLMSKERVDFVVGGFRTEAVLAMQDIAMEYKKIFIGCGAAHPELCNRVAENYDTYKYFFRGTPFNSRYLVKTSFLHLKYVGDILTSQLDIPKLKVAIVAEKAMWADPMVQATEGEPPRDFPVPPGIRFAIVDPVEGTVLPSDRLGGMRVALPQDAELPDSTLLKLEQARVDSMYGIPAAESDSTFADSTLVATSVDSTVLDSNAARHGEEER